MSCQSAPGHTCQSMPSINAVNQYHLSVPISATYQS
ncbi:unnamed protein product, partial [Staurois parvus]